MRSPDYVQLSTAAAITMGLVQGKMYRTSCTHCLNLLVTYAEGCRANCAYCGLARHREESRDYADRNFIRVDWPTLRYDDIIARVQSGQDGGDFERMCISMITHPDSDADSLLLLKKWCEKVPHIPVSILSNPTGMTYEYVREMKDIGADIFTVALDAVTPDIFEQTRGKAVQSPHRWNHYWQVIEWAAEIFGPEKFGVHLICGMGETEKEILQVCQRVRDMGGHNHMFAFFPEAGSMMENWQAVDRAQWRRVQLARFIIDYRDGNVSDMKFDASGRLVHYGVAQEIIDTLVQSGIPFQTSGCPGKDNEVSACNRPFGDSTPADIYSYPFSLMRRDIEVIRRQMSGEPISSYGETDL
jgi:biotin synthase-related radical SAM superfamily protein